MVSALTMLELTPDLGHYATYYELADLIRARFARPKAALVELYSRIVFNVLIGNTDDHARNHAAFWDGDLLDLTPAFDLTPQPRSGGETARSWPSDATARETRGSTSASRTPRSTS